MNQTKPCAWCGKIMHQGRKCDSQFAPIKTCSPCCATSYRWHKCSKSETPDIPDRFCPFCNKKLVRRVGEPLQAWKKRIFCNKSHKAFYSTKIVKPDYSHEQKAIEKAGVKIYERGSEEFNKIAALYL